MKLSMALISIPVNACIIVYTLVKNGIVHYYTVQYLSDVIN